MENKKETKKSLIVIGFAFLLILVGVILLLTGNTKSIFNSNDNKNNENNNTENNNNENNNVENNNTDTNVENGKESNGSELDNSVVVYPSGKTKETVITGDIVTIDKEEFYVVKHDGNDLVLISHYNLNVGDNKKATATEGIQDSEVKGYLEDIDEIVYGNDIKFSTKKYWDGLVGTEYPGSYCDIDTYKEGTQCAYLYDSNSNIYQYVNNYKTYLEGLGAKIKSARLLKVEEAFELGCEIHSESCSNASSWVYETSYWLGSAHDSSGIWAVNAEGELTNGRYSNRKSLFGVRPIIII